MASEEAVNIVTVGKRLKNVSRDYLGVLILDTLPISVAEFEAEALCLDYRRRQAKMIFADGLAALEAAPNEVDAVAGHARQILEQLHKSNHQDDGFPKIMDAAEFIAETMAPPVELVAGILHKGSKLAFGGSSKSFKTWNLLDLGISIGAGLPWLGFQTAKGKVLIVNFEIQPFAFQKRIAAVAAAKGIKLQGGEIDLLNLRGHASDFRQLIPRIVERARDKGYALIILDPIYKLYGNTDENAAGDVAALLNEIERLATETGAAVAFGAHFAKGNAAGKEAIDRISGSGVFARDPDSLLIFTKHEEDGAFTVEPILRNFAPVAPFVVRWEYPLMSRADDLDPAKLKQVGGRPAKHSTEDLLAVLPDGGLTAGEWLERSKKKESTFHRLRRELDKNGKIHFEKYSGKWKPILTRR
jgi:hypothetical protein